MCASRFTSARHTIACDLDPRLAANWCAPSSSGCSSAKILTYRDRHGPRDRKSVAAPRTDATGRRRTPRPSNRSGTLRKFRNGRSCARCELAKRTRCSTDWRERTAAALDRDSALLGAPRSNRAASGGCGGGRASAHSLDLVSSFPCRERLRKFACRRPISFRRMR